MGWFCLSRKLGITSIYLGSKSESLKRKESASIEFHETAWSEESWKVLHGRETTVLRGVDLQRQSRGGTQLALVRKETKETY